MADLAITVAQVMPSTGAKYGWGLAGEVITQGEPLYLKASDGALWATDADASASADCVGIAMTGAAAAGACVLYQYDGDIDLGAGASAAAGQVYIVSATAGKIGLEAELAAADYMTILGVGIGSNKLRLNIEASGIAHA